MRDFKDWINKKFIEWEHASGRRRTLSDFANYLGVSRPIVSMWMNGARTPSRDNVHVLAKIFGAEIYDILGIQRPDPDLEAIKDMWDALTVGQRRAIREQAERYAAGEDPPSNTTKHPSSQAAKESGLLA